MVGGNIHKLITMTLDERDTEPMQIENMNQMCNRAYVNTIAQTVRALVLLNQRHQKMYFI